MLSFNCIYNISRVHYKILVHGGAGKQNGMQEWEGMGSRVSVCACECVCISFVNCKVLKLASRVLLLIGSRLQLLYLLD